MAMLQKKSERSLMYAEKEYVQKSDYTYLCTKTEFFWSVFFRIWTKYRDTPYLDNTYAVIFKINRKFLERRPTQNRMTLLIREK